MSSARLRNVSRLVQRYLDEQKLPGAISLVARRDRVVHCETFGYMDAERRTPMRADSIFRIYSMTKPIASVGLMTLYEEGRFQLDDAAAKFIPELQDVQVFVSTRRRTYFSGSGGLVSTAADYLRFCRMLANGGELEGVRILGPRTLRLMTLNHLPGGTDLASMALGGAETQREGQGFGLGFAVLLDPTVAQIIGTPGEYFWGAAASTAFFVNPVEELIVIFLTQLRPSSTYPIRRELRATVYSAILD
ncbi:MAG TPA: serine hydrolase domain-containing protein [Chloroflexota bacterium]